MRSKVYEETGYSLEFLGTIYKVIEISFQVHHV